MLVGFSFLFTCLTRWDLETEGPTIEEEEEEEEGRGWSFEIKPESTWASRRAHARGPPHRVHVWECVFSQCIVLMQIILLCFDTLSGSMMAHFAAWLRLTLSTFNVCNRMNKSLCKGVVTPWFITASAGEPLQCYLPSRPMTFLHLSKLKPFVLISRPVPGEATRWRMSSFCSVGKSGLSLEWRSGGGSHWSALHSGCSAFVSGGLRLPCSTPPTRRPAQLPGPIRFSGGGDGGGGRG